LGITQSKISLEAAGLKEYAMSQENVEIVRRWLDAWVGWFNSTRDSDRLEVLAAEFMAENVTYEEDPVWPDAGSYDGLDAVVRRFAEYIDLVHVERVEPGEVIEAGDLVVAEVRIAMLGADAGQAVEFLWTYTLAVEDDRIVHFRAWYDRDQALEAAGLRE
jgi:ketosteroid isomerase-like protein